MEPRLEHLNEPLYHVYTASGVFEALCHFAQQGNPRHGFWSFNEDVGSAMKERDEEAPDMAVHY
jgi:hypothetical protein